MKILFLQPQPCIRALKYAYGLKKVQLDEEFDIYFGYRKKTLSEFYGYGDEFINDYIRLEKNDLERQIKNILMNYDIDLIHSHNTPDFLTVAAINATENVDVPVINDIHDLFSIQEAKLKRWGSEKVEKIKEDEKFACENSDANIYVTGGIRDIVHQKYVTKAPKELTFYNFVPSSIIPFQLKEKLSKRDNQIHIVYEGNLNSKVEDDHYDLREIFVGIVERGISLHIYDARNNEDYKELASKTERLYYHGHLDPKNLLQELTQYDFGWAGFNSNKHRKHLDVVFSNKIFEYISSGLPVLSFPHKLQKQFIEKYKLGFILEDLDELPEILEDKERVKKVQEKVLEKRHSFTVENNIHKVIDLYRSLVPEVTVYEKEIIPTEIGDQLVTK